MTGPGNTYTRASIRALRRALADGTSTATALLETFQGLVAEHDGAINAVLQINQAAAREASAIDASWYRDESRPLAGIPILVKDNIAVSGTPTTAGSRALLKSTPDDAELVARLRRSGAIIAGKTNLSEWGGFRSALATAGWSAVGGQTRNPHDPSRSPSGSSSGSAAAVACGFVPAAIGTETHGSILSPAGTCGVVGLKPTLGSIPTTGIVPVSPRQDVAGPITHTVQDAATLYSILSRAAPVRWPDPPDVVGVGLALWLPPHASRESATVLLGVARRLESEGCHIEQSDLDASDIAEAMLAPLLSEFRQAIDGYLRDAPGSRVRSLTELIAFNAADPVEHEPFGQDLFDNAIQAPATSDDRYLRQRKALVTRAQQFYAEALQQGRLDAIITLTNEPAPLLDQPNSTDRLHTAAPAAAAGYPAVTVPGGAVGGMPVGITLTGPAHSEQRLLEIAARVEALGGLTTTTNEFQA
jgi:amidase